MKVWLLNLILIEKKWLWCIIEKNIKMNFKERGFTVGDLTILVIVILLSLFLINKYKESKSQKQTFNVNQIEICKYFND